MGFFRNEQTQERSAQIALVFVSSSFNHLVPHVRKYRQEHKNNALSKHVANFSLLLKAKQLRNTQRWHNDRNEILAFNQMLTVLRNRNAIARILSSHFLSHVPLFILKAEGISTLHSIAESSYDVVQWDNIKMD